MFKNERLERILDLLERKKEMTTADLQEALFVSGSTLRRDLIELEKMGKVTREFGHVEIVRPDNVELSYLFREQEHEEAKRAIAESASIFLSDNQAVFVDSSSTASFLAPYVAVLHNMVVITNGLRLAVQLDGIQSVKTYVSGGRVRPGSGSLLGEDTVAFLEDFRADLAFVSCTGVTTDGIFMSSLEQSSVKRKMISGANKTVLLCDHSKFGVKSYYRLADASQITAIVTDQEPDPEDKAYWESQNVELIY